MAERPAATQQAQKKAKKSFPLWLSVHGFVLIPLLAGALLLIAPPPPARIQSLFARLAFPSSAPAAEAKNPENTRLFNDAIAAQQSDRYDDAVTALRTLEGTVTDEAMLREVRFRLAHVLYLNDQPEEAKAALSAFLTRYPDDDRRLEATSMLGRTEMVLGNYGEAIAQFTAYRATPNLIDGYLALEIGKAYLQADRPSEAVPELQRASTAGLGRLATIESLERLADAYTKLGDFANVSLAWQRIQPLASTNVYKAEILYRLGINEIRRGNTQAGAQYLLQVTQTYPELGWAATAMRSLAAINVDPGAYWRGIINYYADAEADAVSALNSFMKAEPSSPNMANALLYRGLSYRYLGQPDKAMADFETAATRYASQAKADEANYQAGILQETLDKPVEAAAQYRNLLARFPNSSRREDAQYRLALAAYEQHDLTAAQALLTQLRATARQTAFTADANLWLGKIAAAKNDTAAANQYWTAAGLADPDGIAGLRAQSLQAGESLPTGALPSGTLFKPDTPADFEALDQWVSEWTHTPITPSWNLPGPKLQSEPMFRRSSELLRAGFSAEASNELQDLADALKSDPVALYQFVLWLQDKDSPKALSYAAEQLAAVSPTKSLTKVPKLLLRMVMPTPYRSLVEENSTKFGIDPALLYALIRQESAYNRYATSSAQARGLTQVIPDTGKSIAQALGKTGFTADDLYRPATSIEFGSYYLAQALKTLGGNAFFALGAYNAGPYSVPKWNDGDASFDPDLFIERITYRETQSYVRLVGKYYYLYRLAYRD